MLKEIKAIIESETQMGDRLYFVKHSWSDCYYIE